MSMAWVAWGSVVPQRRVWVPTLVAILALGMGACGGDGDGDDGAGDTDVLDVGGDARDGGVDDTGDAGGGDVTPDAAALVYTEERAVCADRNPERNLYFGDLHVHTALSFDAWVIDTRATPADAYSFARGETLLLPPLDDSGEGTQPLALDRPLDFAAVTDHSEYLAEIDACTTEGSPAYDTPTCRSYRIADQNTIIQVGGRLTNPRPSRFADICAEIDCPARAGVVWERIQEQTEAAYDRSDRCAFTAFHAYEYSAATGISNLHRNVIFRNDRVPEFPTSYFDEPTPTGLWDRLEADCLDAGDGCDVLAIPHNSNWANGNLFALDEFYAGSADEQRAAAERRAALEPLVEIFQHKGDSECVNGLPSTGAEEDPLCDFEKLRSGRLEDCGDDTGTGAMAGLGCTSRLDFVRYVLQAGLAEEARLGVNPYRLGITAATDTHNGTPGAVSESGYLGHFGSDEATPETRLAPTGLTPGGFVFGPGGLMAVWAQENSRDALFDAMRRREVYGTSGPRMAVRFFGGWDYPTDLCDAADLVARGYADGVPMGGELPSVAASAGEAGDDAGPTFVASAMADVGGESTPLERIQIIKGWLGADGVLRERVFDVVGEPLPDTALDLDTCEPPGGPASLCTVWRDPEFDPAERAFYYARVVEAPTCRWSHRLCLDLPAEGRPENCDDPDVPRSVRERAWTSPIWYRPDL